MAVTVTALLLAGGATVWAAAPDEPVIALGPVEPTAGATAEVLLRGFTDEELAAAQKAVPPHPDPPLGTPVPRKVKVAGRVFEDANRNGTPDAGEPGLGGVQVTDGETVARTDAAGRFAFSLAIDSEPRARFVVATRPTGYKPTTPYFLRIPFAETRTEYRADLGFAKDALSLRRDFSFISCSDSQFTGPAEMLSTAKDYAQVTAAPGDPAFLVTVGDLTMSGTHWQWDMYDRIRGASQVIVYDGFGGHDGNCLKPRSTANYELRIGPPYYSWDYGGVHFVQFVTETAYLGPRGTARQEAWLLADLKSVPRGTPVVTVTHHPLPAAWFEQREAEGIKVIAQLAGHWHVVQRGSHKGIPVLICAPARGRDWGSYTTAYRWVRITPEGLRSELRIAGQYQRLDCVAPGPTALLGSQPLVVLAYDSARIVRRVVCTVVSPEGKTQTLPLARQGDWSWHGLLAPDTPGQWRLDLRATDCTGAGWHRQQEVQVTDARLQVPRPDTDFPWILAGRPSRRVPSGPVAPLYPLWVKHTGSVHVLHASPAAAAGRVYVTVSNPNAGSPNSGLLCLDARTGQELWRANSPLGDVRGPVAVHEGRFFAVSAEGWAAAFHAQTGQPLWRRPLHESYRTGRPLAINQASPVPTAHGLLVSDWQTPQLLLDYATGKQLARLAGNTGIYAAFATAFDDTMYCAWRGGRVAIKIPSGQAAWQGDEAARSTSAGIVADGKFLYTAGSTTKALDAATGKVLWQATVPNVGHHQPIPIVWDDLVLVNGTACTAVDLGTGKPRWSVACGREPDRFARSQRQVLAGSSTPLVAGSLAYFGHDDTSIRAVLRSGKLVWQHRLGTPVKTAPVACGNLLLVHDYAGNLWCLAPAQAATR
jgi:outer membrane protein assembly factor BamB